MNTASLILEDFTGDILCKAGPVAVIIIEVIVKELDHLRLETDKAVRRSRRILGQPDILHDGVSPENGLIESNDICGSGVVLLIVQVDGQDHIAKLDTLGKDAIHGQELLMIPDFDVEQVIRAAILRLDDLPDMDGRIPLEQRLHLLLVSVPAQQSPAFCPG